MEIILTGNSQHERHLQYRAVEKAIASNTAVGKLRGLYIEFEEGTAVYVYRTSANRFRAVRSTPIPDEAAA